MKRIPRIILNGEIEAHQIHKVFIPNLCKNLLNKGNFVFVDVGANHGLFSRRVLQYSPNIKIIGFEPQLSCQSDLESISSKSKNFEFKNIGIGSKRGKLKFHQFENDGLSSFCVLENNAYGSHALGESENMEYDVEVSTLDHELKLFEDEELFVIKIDVQGFEKEVLDGAKNLFNDQRINGVVIELMLVSKYDNDTFEYFITYLSDKGFILSDICNGFRDLDSGFIHEFDALFIHKNFNLV